MAWTSMPPAGGSLYTYYQWVAQFPKAIQERYGAISGCNYNWPPSTHVWASGRITSIDDNGDGTLNINCEILDTDGETWITPDWVGGRHPTDGPDVKWWTDYSPPTSPNGGFPWEPSAYKIALWPKHNIRSGGLASDGKFAHTLHINDNGEAYVKVTDDGVLTLNGKTLANYGSSAYEFEIIRSGGISEEQRGYSWVMRFPPHPNCTTYAYGYVCQVVKVAVTDTEEWTLTISGHTTPALAIDINASELHTAIVAVLKAGNPLFDEDDVRVQGDAEEFTLIFSTGDGGVGDVLPTATGATVTEPDNIIGDTTTTFTDEIIGKDVVFTVGPKWHRTDVTSVDSHTLTFTDIGDEANVNNYFAVVESDGDNTFWRPHFFADGGFPKFQVDTVQRVTRSGRERFWESSTYWCPQTWWQTFSSNNVDSHNPVTDDVGGYAIPATFETIEICDSNLCECELYIPDGGREDRPSFDFDFTIDFENFCTAFSDTMYNPWMHWTLRGWHADVEGLVPFWVTPTYTPGGATVAPIYFTLATWFAYHTAANTRTATISSINGSGQGVISISMPTQTTQAGAWPILDCDFTIKNADGTTFFNGTGTVTSSLLTTDTYGPEEDPETDLPPEAAGKSVVISFRWTRKYERMFRYLYPRNIVTFDENDDGPVNPPTECSPGNWLREETPSTTYSEFTKYGEFEATSTAFIDGESARYMGNFWDEPTGFSEADDLLSQVNPSPTSDFPEWSKSGTATDGGTTFLENTNVSFWLSSSPLITHEGTGTAGGSTTVLKDSALYKLWSNCDAEHTQTLRLSQFWTGVNATRFVGMELELKVHEADPMVTGDVDVWETRLITAQNVATPSNPALTVAPAFSTTTVGKAYRIREPGSTSRGAIRDTFKSRPLIVTKPSGATYTVTITNSSEHRLYFAATAGLTVEAGDSYVIDEIAPGSVVHRKAGEWVKPEDATADTRGHAWFEGAGGMLQNCPTIVTNYGRLRKWDIVTYEYFGELYRGLNCMRYRSFDGNWASHGECNWGTRAGDSPTEFYVDDTPACDTTTHTCIEDNPFNSFYCTWEAAFLRNTAIYEGCTEGCCHDGNCDDCEFGPPLEGVAPRLTLFAAVDFATNCGTECGDDVDGFAPMTWGATGSMDRVFAYYDGNVPCCWDSGLTVKSYVKASAPGGGPSGSTDVCEHHHPDGGNCVVDGEEVPLGEIELCTTQHVAFMTDGEPLSEGVYSLIQTVTSDGAGDYVGSVRIGPPVIETQPPAPPMPTPGPFVYDAGFGCGCHSGLWNSLSNSGFQVDDDFSFVDYGPKFTYIA